MSVFEEVRLKLHWNGVIPTLLGICFELIGRSYANAVAQHLASMLGNRRSIEGIIVDLSNKRIDNNTKRAILTGGYEFEERILVNKYLDSDTDVVELGMGIGFISCHINTHLSDGVYQVSLEANEELVPLSETNMELNACEYDIINKAYSPNSSKVKFSKSDNFLTGQIDEEIGELEVPACSLSKLVKETELDTFNLIADIEGAEKRLIESELNLLMDSCPLFIVEVHNVDSITDNHMHNQLVSNGFHLADSIKNVSVYKNSKFEV